MVDEGTKWNLALCFSDAALPNSLVQPVDTKLSRMITKWDTGHLNFLNLT